MAHLFALEPQAEPSGVDVEDRSGVRAAVAVEHAVIESADRDGARGASLPWDREARVARRWRVDPLPEIAPRSAGGADSRDTSGDASAVSAVEPLAAPLASVALVGDAELPLHAAPPDAAPESTARLVASRDEDGRVHWVAMAASDAGLRVNGERIGLGARVLRHRDELRLQGVTGRAVFSLEALCRVAPFEGPEGAVCPRCRSAIALGAPSVRCARCRTAYHQDDERPCWSYAPTCAHDDQSTALDAGYRFRPEEDDDD